MDGKPKLPMAAEGERAGAPLAARLLEHTVEGTLYERRDDGALRCTACAHRCVIAQGSAGACAVRVHHSGALRVPFGYIARRYVRSVETNTVYHVRPGAKALTFGMFGCDLRCPYCHNHKVSQALRDRREEERPRPVRPEDLVAEAVAAGCEVMCAAYNEPMITAEWARAVFTEAKRAGLTTALISDGNTTPEALDLMRPVTDVYRIDLKGYTEEQYRTLGGRLRPVLQAIGLAHQLGYWVEVVTLVVPGFNDHPLGLARLAEHIASVDAAIPWHLNAFVPRYKLSTHVPPSPASLMSAVGTAYAKGLEFVYASNLLSLTELGHTRCPGCHHVLVERHDYTTRAVDLRDGGCPRCERKIPGLWAA